MKLLLGGLTLLCAAAAQPLSIGLKAGADLTGDLDTYWATSESKRLTFGPTIVVHLPRGFGVEFDALYRRVGYRFAAGFGNLEEDFTRAVGNSWRFPILLRKTVGRGVYAAAGYAPQIINGSEDTNVIQATTLEANAFRISRFHNPGEWNTAHGVVVAAGIERKLGPARFAPEVRYIWWGAPALDVNGSRGFSIESRRNEVELLFSVRFP